MRCSILLTFLFAVTGGSVAMRECAHGTVAPDAASGDAADPAAHHHRGGVPVDDDAPAPCTCIGTCHGSSTMPVGSALVDAPRATVRLSLWRAPADARPRACRRHFLPYPTGPPRS